MEKVLSLFKKRDQTRLEEYGNSATHYLGALLSLIGAYLLFGKSSATGGLSRQLSTVIYGGSLVFLYLMSGTYHILRQGERKNFFCKLDHLAIYIVIASTYTFLLVNSLEGAGRYYILAAQWAITTFGIFFKLKFGERFAIFSVSLYLAMGWMIVLVFKDLIANLPEFSLIFLVIGGITYSLGVLFYILENVLYSHVVWHIMVLLGTAFIYLAIYYSF